MFGRPSSMTAKRSSNPFTGNVQGPRRSSLGHTGTSCSELNLAQMQRPQGSGMHQHFEMQMPWAGESYESPTFDPRPVQQWRATSATTIASPTRSSLSSVMTSQPFEPPNYLQLATSDILSPVSDVSLHTHFGFDNFDACDFSPLVLPHSTVGESGSLLASSAPGTLDPRLTHPGTSGAESYAFEAPVTLSGESYSTPVSLASIDALSMDIHPSLPLMNGDSSDSNNQWINGDDFAHETSFGPLCQEGFSREIQSTLSAVAMDRNVSSHSHNSHWVSLNGSPVPSSPVDAYYSAESHGVSEGQYMMTPQSRDDSYTHLTSHENAHNFESSSLRSANDYQVISLTGIPVRNKDYGSFSVQGPLSVGDSKAARRASGDVTEEPPPRHHEYYSVEKPKGELYECPYKATENCNHPPEALKCNYHKHLDSHFKPYRCKLPKCKSVVFSSTACQLRHEREAHGMHGHGDKPFRCDFPDCARYIDGFPRRWNARDHMKRIHNHIPAESPSRSHSPTSSTVSSQSNGKVTTISTRKRRTSSISKPESNKRSKSSEAKESAKALKAKTQKLKIQTLQKEWNEQRLALKERLDNLDPTKVLNPEQFASECAALQNIGEELSRLSQGEPPMLN